MIHGCWVGTFLVRVTFKIEWGHAREHAVISAPNGSILFYLLEGQKDMF